MVNKQRRIFDEFRRKILRLCQNAIILLVNSLDLDVFGQSTVGNFSRIIQKSECIDAVQTYVPGLLVSLECHKSYFPFLSKYF